MNFSETLDFLDVPAAVSFTLEPEQALAIFRAKGLRPSFSYADLQAEEHAVAFSVAKMMDLDLVQDVHDALESALAEGLSFDEFKNRVVPTLQAKGWWGRQAVRDPLTGQVVVAQLGSPSRLKTIFRTNMQSAYAAGHWDQIARQADEAPYLMYDAIDDHRTRPEHAAWDDTVLPVDHAWWKTHYPPNGYQCRCSVIQLDDSDLESLGIEPDERAPRTRYEDWKNPRTGRTERIPAGVDPGFAHNPGQARLDGLAQLLREKAAAFPPDLRQPALRGVTETRRAYEAAQTATAALRAQAELDRIGSEAALESSARRLLALSDDELERLVTAAGMSRREQEELLVRLRAFRRDLGRRFPGANPEPDDTR